ncbi:MAG TPA: phosphoglucosamine mutase [Blastocatellia bacterium]|nr:phosphoglucosamine mutase [Blastocatellia bacterium]
MPEGEARKLFGTDGIRGVAGEYPLDDNTVGLTGLALVSNLARGLGRAPRIVIGRDTRESGPQIEQALARAAISAGAEVESAGVITTPGIAYITRATPFDAGVVISASHNPYRDNGIKVFSNSGKKLADEMERRIEADIHERTAEGRDLFERMGAAFDEASGAFQRREADYRQQYLAYLENEVGRGLNLEGLSIGVDCANGAACEIAPVLFRRLGARLEVISNAPDGRNINERCGSLHLEGLERLVIENRLDLGIAFDGDADRALFVDSEGKLVDGDATLLLLADYLKSRGRLAKDLVVATVMSNIGLELALRERRIELARAAVGDRYVLEELLKRGAKLGGEQSGHIIFPDISLAGDGMITALELLRAVRQSGRSLSELASQMKRYPQVLVNVRVRSKPELETLPEVKAAIDRLEGELQGRGRLLVRYSGTENLARVMIEGEDQQKIEEQANRLADSIRKAIGE